MVLALRQVHDTLTAQQVKTLVMCTEPYWLVISRKQECKHKTFTSSTSSSSVLVQFIIVSHLLLPFLIVNVVFTEKSLYQILYPQVCNKNHQIKLIDYKIHEVFCTQSKTHQFSYLEVMGHIQHFSRQCSFKCTRLRSVTLF